MTDTPPAPVAGKRGRKPPRTDVRWPELRAFGYSATTSPPSANVWPADADDPGILGNDAEGDCVPAGTENNRISKGLYQGDTKPSETVTLDLYHAFGIAQGEPGPAPDEGCDMGTWFHWLFEQIQLAKAATPDDVDEIAYAKLDIANDAELHVAMIDFRGVLLGVLLDDNAESDFNASPRIPWPFLASASPDPEDGHCVLLVSYDATVLASPERWQVRTWDGLQPVDIAVNANSSLEEAWVIVTREDAEATGVDFDALVAYIKSIGGTVAPQPDPTPSPAPTPEPTPPSPAPSPAPPVTPPAPEPSPPSPPSPAPSPLPPPSPGPLPEIEKVIEEALEVIREAASDIPPPYEIVGQAIAAACEFIEQMLRRFGGHR